MRPPQTPHAQPDVATANRLEYSDNMTSSQPPPSPPARASDPRLESPSFHRNGDPMVAALAQRLADADGDVLEIGSGSGQHIAHFASRFSHLRFWPSDPNQAYRASIDAWRAHFALDIVQAAIDLDVSEEPWALGPDAPSGGFDAILCANVVHIAPWSVAEGLFRGAAPRLKPAGFLALYGPFRWYGAHVSASNAAFDAGLRARNPEWGVRDVDDLDASARARGLARVDCLTMPSNNHFLIYQRAA